MTEKISMFFCVLFALLTISLVIWSINFVSDQTYVVYKVWPNGPVVRVLDPEGKEVNVKDFTSGKTTHTIENIVWVSEDYDYRK